MQPIIIASSRPVLVDERFAIVVQNLQQFQHVTLRVELRSEKNEVYEALGHFIADSHGAVSLNKDPSFGGTYTGIDEMGLFWSLRPAPGQRRGLRYIPKNIDKPMKFKVELFDGHIDSYPEEKTLLASTTVLRTYLAPWVEKKEINVGRLRGSLFFPKGEGRFPGVVEMFGTVGGLLEHRAALMASHGFATFALAFMRYKDLPNKLADVELEYFLEAVEWFSKHEKVYKNGVGYVGVSYGGQVALHVASLSSLVKAVVAISSPTFFPTIKYKNKLLGMSAFYKVDNADICNEVVVTKNIPDKYPEAIRNCRIKVENISGQVLCVTGEDDQCLNSSQMAEEMREAIPNKVTHVAYPRTGHLIEPPYMPFCSVSFHKVYHRLTGWGGNVVQHASAQEHSWKSMLSFLKNNLLEVPKSKF
eukprot:gene17002-18715_t